MSLLAWGPTASDSFATASTPKKNTPETRMFPHLCQFRQGRQGRFQPSLEKKNIGKEGEERRKEKRECGAATLSKLSTLSAICQTQYPCGFPEVWTFGRPCRNPVGRCRNAIKYTQNWANVKRQTLKSRLLNPQCRSTRRGQHCWAEKSLKRTNIKSSVKRPTPTSKGDS